MSKSNHPLLGQSPDNVRAYQTGRCRAIIASETLNFSTVEKCIEAPAGEVSTVASGAFRHGAFVRGVFIAQEVIDRGYTPERLTETLSGELWCYRRESAEMLPTHPEAYRVIARASNVDDPALFRIELHDEECLLDVLANSHKYGLDHDRKVWVRLGEEEAERNFYKAIIQYHAARDIGNVESRIADYARLILVCLQALRPNLSEEQREILSPLLDRKVTAGELGRIAQRERRLYKVLDRFRNRQHDQW